MNLTDAEIQEAIGYPNPSPVCPHHRRIAQAGINKVIDLIKQKLEETCAIVKDGKQTRSGVSVLDELLKELEG
jgi:hypothetical protein